MQTEQVSTNGKTTGDVAGINVLAIPIGQIVESQTNPRKRFEQLDELAKSMKEHGQLTPGTARETGKKYELVFGARRFRALKKAGADYMLLTIAKMTDAEAEEAQLVENCQREDVHPLEEADAIERLAKKYGYTVEAIAAKLSRDVVELRRRMKLSALGPKLREAFLAGKVDAAHAFLFARIPHHDLQAKALEELSRFANVEGQLPPVATMKPAELRALALELVCLHGNAFEIGATLRNTAAALKIDVAKVAKSSALEEKAK